MTLPKYICILQMMILLQKPGICIFDRENGDKQSGTVGAPDGTEYQFPHNAALVID